MKYDVWPANGPLTQKRTYTAIDHTGAIDAWAADFGVSKRTTVCARQTRGGRKVVAYTLTPVSKYQLTLVWALDLDEEITGEDGWIPEGPECD